MVTGLDETAEQLRSRHVRTTPPSTESELGSREDLQSSILAQMQILGLLEDADAAS